MTIEMDIRDILANIQAPTLIIHRTNHPAIPVESARYLADHIPDARFELPGTDALPYTPTGGDDVRGIVVHIGARVAALAGPGEVLASSTVKDLVVGSGIDFAA